VALGGNLSTAPSTSRRRSVSVEFYTNEEIIRAAHRRLAQGPWDYLSGGTESETSLRRRLAFDRLALRPRVLVDVSQRPAGIIKVR